MGLLTFGKGPPVIASPNFSDPATIASYSGFDSDEDAERLQTMQPSDRAQSTSVSGGVSITYDRGESYPINLVSFLFGNVSGTGSWRVQAADTIAALDTGPRIDSSLGWGSALVFDGGTGTAFATSSSWNAMTSFSLSVRIRHDLRYLTQGIARFQGSPAYGVLEMGADGRVHWKSSTGTFDLVSTNAIPVGEWTRVTGTYNAGTSTVTLIVNGVQVASAGSISGWITTPNLLSISTVNADRFRGAIDDVRLFNVARTAAQELADLYGEIATPPASLVGYWKLNELGGNLAANTVSGPSMSLSGTPFPRWSFPERYWTSPNLDSWPKRHSLYYDWQAVVFRYLKVTVIDPENTDGFLHFGRFYASAAHQLTQGCQYSSQVLGYKDPSLLTRPASGVGPFVRRAAQAPVRKVRFWSTSEEEVFFNVDNIARLRGGSQDCLWVMRPWDVLWRHHSMIYCLDQAESEISAPSLGLYEHAHVLEGIV